MAIKLLMQKQKVRIRLEKPKIYSHDLMNNLFRHPYTKIEFVMEELSVSRQTASKYLQELVSLGVLEETKLAKEKYFFNTELYQLLNGFGDKVTQLYQ